MKRRLTRDSSAGDSRNFRRADSTATDSLCIRRRACIDRACSRGSSGGIPDRRGGRPGSFREFRAVPDGGRDIHNFRRGVREDMPNSSSYIVIVTRGHKDDMRVLQWAVVRTEARYIGMIGSKRKALSVFKALQEGRHARRQIRKGALAGRTRNRGDHTGRNCSEYRRH